MQGNINVIPRTDPALEQQELFAGLNEQIIIDAHQKGLHQLVLDTAKQLETPDYRPSVEVLEALLCRDAYERPFFETPELTNIPWPRKVEITPRLDTTGMAMTRQELELERKVTYLSNALSLPPNTDEQKLRLRSTIAHNPQNTHCHECGKELR